MTKKHPLSVEVENGDMISSIPGNQGPQDYINFENCSEFIKQNFQDQEEYCSPCSASNGDPADNDLNQKILNKEVIMNPSICQEITSRSY